MMASKKEERSTGADPFPPLLKFPLELIILRSCRKSKEILQENPKFVNFFTGFPRIAKAPRKDKRKSIPWASNFSLASRRRMSLRTSDRGAPRSESKTNMIAGGQSYLDLITGVAIPFDRTWRRSRHSFPSGGSCHKTALWSRVVTDEGN